MIQLTASYLANVLDALDKNAIYTYPNAKTRTEIRIIDVRMPEGPVTIKRRNPSKGESFDDAASQTISSKMLWRLASAIKENHPVNIDRIFGASYNTRSALESLLLHTECFYLCYPGRLEKVGPNTEVKAGHKHILFDPANPHDQGKIILKEVNDMVVTEIDREVRFDSLLLNSRPSKKVDIELNRRHAQIQVLLIKAAASMGLITWVASNDHSIQYNGQKLIEMDEVLKSMETIPALLGYPKAPEAGRLIDCIWFTKDGKKIPAILEIEHSTGVTSGLTRMKNFMLEAPDLRDMTYIIVAPDEIREQVFKKAAQPQFGKMNVKYLSYSAVEDLYLLSQRKIQGIDNIKFFHTFLESIISLE
ncbi:hypothetical protein [Marinomonas sp. A3A]|uniref:hypothetical protein n=1 Tax=Marinomonas sp. A3A TaxID=2065312 RepID=UPI001BB43247|nr:hypothetical protein [Marinomonas sp. A3A]